MKINNIWELLLILNIVVSLVIHALKNGERSKAKYNFPASLIASFITILWFYLAGLFR